MFESAMAHEISGKSGINKEFAEEFRNIIYLRQIATKFQPIICLSTGTIIGYEGLSRGPEGSIFENPALLFEVAEKLELLEELDMLCREMAVSNAKRIFSDIEAFKLFINIDPACLTYPEHDRGKTQALINDYGLDMDNIVLEITERIFIKNPEMFYEALTYYQSQGFSIAVDDFGNGSAGLKLIAGINPQVVKIDKFLVGQIDSSTQKQGILKMVVEMCHNLLNAKVIAEGIESIEEYRTVKELGVDWGQGYLLGKPSFQRQAVPISIKNTIVFESHCCERTLIDETKIGSIASSDTPVFQSDTLVGELVEMFNKNNKILGVPIVDEGVPVGIIMKTELFAALSHKYGFDLFHKRSLSYVMNSHFLAVDIKQSIDSVAKKALARNFSRLYDAFIITKENKYYGIVTVHALLERMTDLKVRYASQSNPLTGLPGNIGIRAFLEEEMKNNRDFACVYFDLDNFKAYNDTYGFSKGDEVIKKTAELIMETFSSSRIGYVGHIGGDDFIAVIQPEEIQELCVSFIGKFDAEVPAFYTDDDIKRGYIETVGRNNGKCAFPLISISLAVVTSLETSRCNSFLEIGKIAAEVKKKVKAITGSAFLINKRKIHTAMTDKKQGSNGVRS